MAIDLPEHLVQLQREANMARQEAATREYSSEGWKPWLDAVDAVHAAVTEYAKEKGVSRHEVEKAVKTAAKASEAPPEPPAEA
ncbi:hypothetical protein OOK31_25450 [Streptomyces sp. NBC_00249]|uniref:hypothetical protein n=1 Tax=Streptomyces sp. NBC_00249 TaxID=2975690 RepID=UPI0022555913|nr:hypothetical protein [Streptomyces sp. NBC_00249]MCX5197203.1 hypothetical protein [Streptomyces sp. NBC_00249]